MPSKFRKNPSDLRCTLTWIDLQNTLDPLWRWAPDCDSPQDDETYVQLHRAAATKRYTLEKPTNFLFDVVPTTATGIDGRVYLRHANSKLYVTGRNAQRGLLWLTSSMSKALPFYITRLSWEELPAHVFISEAQRIGTWLVRITAGASLMEMGRYNKPRVTREDLGVSTVNRCSLVLHDVSNPTAPRLDVLSGLLWLAQSHTGNLHQPQTSSSLTVKTEIKEEEDEEQEGTVPEEQMTTSNTEQFMEIDLEQSSADEEVLEDAIRRRDAFTVFTRRRHSRKYYQDRCVYLNRPRRSIQRQWECCSPGCEAFAVLAFGQDDPMMATFLSLISCPVAAKETEANCFLSYLEAGLDGTPSRCSIPVLFSLRKIDIGEPFVLSRESFEKLQYKCEQDWYIHRQQQQQLKAEDTDEGSSGDSEMVLPTVPLLSFGVWPPEERYYFGNHKSMSLLPTAAAKSRSHRKRPRSSLDCPYSGIQLTYPFSLLQVRPCPRLGAGQYEVIAGRPILKGTTFLYCGPRIQPSHHKTHRCTTVMAVGNGNQRIRGGNIMRFVNHHFGFATQGNVAFRKGTLVDSMDSRSHTHIVFFVATQDIAVGERLLADSYGPEYDSVIERVALCDACYLSVEDRDEITNQQNMEKEKEHSKTKRTPVNGTTPKSVINGTPKLMNGTKTNNTKSNSEESHQESPSKTTPASSPSPSSSVLLGSTLPYHGCYQQDIRHGSLVAVRRRPSSVVTSASHSNNIIPMHFYCVHRTTTDNLLLAVPLDSSEFPYIRTMRNVLVVPLRKTEVILLVPGWDYTATVEQRRRTSDDDICFHVIVKREQLLRVPTSL